MPKKKLDPKATKKAVAKESKDAWVGDAYRDWIASGRNYNAIAKKYGQRWHTVRNKLDAYSNQRAAELRNGSDPLAIYLDSLQDVERHAKTVLLKNPENPNAQIGALRVVIDCLEKLAGALGVVTKWEGRKNENSGADFSKLTPEERLAMAKLEAKLSGDGNDTPDGI